MQPEVVGLFLAFGLGLVKLIQFWVYWEFRKDV